MSEENVELTRQAIDAWNRRDLETIIALSHPDVEYVNAPTAVEPGTRRGRDALESVVRAQWDGLLDGRTDIDRIYDRGDEVIVLTRTSQRLAGSDARVGDPSLLSYTFRDGLGTRVAVLGVGVAGVEQAMRDAGLEPVGSGSAESP